MAKCKFCAKYSKNGFVDLKYDQYYDELDYKKRYNLDYSNQIYIYDNKLRIFEDPGYIDINYCPICGRELKEY